VETEARDEERTVPGGSGLAAVWLRWRSELRSRWRAWLAVAALVGLAGGVVIAAAAGARRTDSAYPRFLRAYKAADVLIADDGEVPQPFDLRKVERLPQVAEAVRGTYQYTKGDFAYFAPADNRVGTSVNRFKILQGRRPNPSRIDEIAVSFAVGKRLGLTLGATMPLNRPDEVAMARKHHFRLPPQVIFRVVAIEAAPGEFPPQYVGGVPVVHMTPAFYRTISHRFEPRDSMYIRLKRGAADLPAFRAELARLNAGKGAFYLTQQVVSAPTRRSIHLQAIALWVLAALTALVALLVLAQTLARQTFLESTEFPTLRAIGMTRVQLWLLGMGRAAAIGCFGAGLAVGLALLLSPLTPFGLARTAEPDPGFALDGPALGLGALATVVLVALLAAVPAWRVARLAGSALGTVELATPERPSLVAGWAARVGLPPTVVVGARMALEPGRGRTAVPVRTTIAGVTIGLAALAAALTFGASLKHLLATPRLYGWNWDAAVTDYGSGRNSDLFKYSRRIAAVPGIDSFSLGASGIPLVVGGEQVTSLAIEPVEGSVLPPILQGRPPSAATEVALGAKTLRRLGAHVGDTIEVGITGAPQQAVTVVGRTVIPALVGGDARLGEGALLSVAGMRRLAPKSLAGAITASDVYLRVTPGADTSLVLARLKARVWPQGGRDPSVLPFAVLNRETPSDILNFGRVENLPFVLAAILAALAAATLAHMLVSAIRRRRRDVAVLKTVGFVRRQVVAAIAWQATTLASVAILVGVPLGVAAGRWTWAVFADRLGVVREPVIPVAPVLLTIPATLLAANLVALLPARLAVRTEPARVLRTE
jgi:ABC-type lipoprotein release transport system permease subunit